MFRLSIVTPEKVFFDGQVKSLTAPGSEGYLGVLAHHAPLISALKPGKIEFQDANNVTQVIAVSGGFLEVSGNVATIIAEAVEYASDIDIARARAAYEKNKNLLTASGLNSPASDLLSVKASMARAENRIKVYESVAK